MHNAPLRSEIEKALDELERYEEGMRFQPLAVVLAKQRWPDLVAAERKNDLGLDAFVTSVHATDGIGRGLACSITPAYSKIVSDAKKVREHFGDQIQRLVFATSGKVSTPKKLDWIKQLREKFGFELEVISREDIVTSLTAPQNVGLCRTYLRLDLGVDLSLTTVVEKIRAAALEEAGNWARRVVGHPLIALQATGVEPNGADGDTVWSLGDIEAALRDARRLVLEAPAGRGKTTTLFQLAQGGLSGDGAVFFIDLPSWVKSGQAILPFIAGMAAFERRGLTSQQLAQSEPAERFYFLLNGWNEVTESLLNDAAIVMRDLERQFPSAGMIVATRAHYISPPLPGATRMRLRRISHRTRAAYVRQRLGEQATGLLTVIDSDPTLDELTRTPFALSEIAAIVAAGELIPRTRVGLMDAVIRLHEQSAEHEAQLLSAPLRGMFCAYLESLAIEMFRSGSVSLSDSEARAAAHRMSGVLTADGQINTAPPPADILNALCAHHVLERLDYPDVAYRFEHQLFQEYFGSRGLRRAFRDLARSDTGSDGHPDFVRAYVNEPAWSEPFQMLAETLSVEPIASSRRGQQNGPSQLLYMALRVDPIFAAQLAYALGVTSGDPSGKILSQRLREWYSSSDSHHRGCAIAAMLASGLDLFRDIIEPILSTDDEQTRLRTYRLWRDFRLSTLGTDWQRVVREWPEDARSNFVSEVLHHRFVPAVSTFALADSSKKVRQSAMQALSWIGAEEEFTRGAGTLDDDNFARLILATSPKFIPQGLHARARSVLEHYPSDKTDISLRLRALLALHELKDPNAASGLKLVLEQLAVDKFGDLDESLVESAVDAVRDRDPTWTSEWVARRIATGALWSDRWRVYVTAIPKNFRDEQFDRLATQNVEHRRLEGSVMVVTKDADPDIARRAFLRFLEVQQSIKSASDGQPKIEWEIHRQIEALLRSISASVVVSGLSDMLAQDPNPDVVEALLYLYGRIGMTDADRIDLDEPSREPLRGYIRRSAGLVRAKEDPSGNLKAEFASVVSQIGDQTDIADVVANVRADIQRMRLGRAARARGESEDYASITQTHSYVRSIVALLGDNADGTLLQLLEEPEYEAAVIEEFGHQFDGSVRRELGRRQGYEQVWEARAGRLVNDVTASRRARVAEAIRNRMMRLEDTRREEADPQHLNHRLKKLALGLAQTNPMGCADLILDTMLLKSEFDAHMHVDAAEHLLFSGVVLPADKCLPLLDDALERMKKWGMQDHERWDLIRFLGICPYVAPQAAGIMKMRQIIQQARLRSYDFRDVLPALGYSRFDGALELMRELVPSIHEWRAVENEWIRALALLDTEDARRAVLGLVDPELPGLPFATDSAASDQAAARIAQIAAGDAVVDARLRALSLLSLDEPKRHLLAKALASRGTPESLLGVLNLMDDAASPRIPW
ncbi:MAG: hypothetical protein M3Z54_02305, partial [Gemmatimonadota bacterium]|nr:hypothetical protein [Gemmatimonadota bacterium]